MRTRTVSGGSYVFLQDFREGRFDIMYSMSHCIRVKGSTFIVLYLLAFINYLRGGETYKFYINSPSIFKGGVASSLM